MLRKTAIALVLAAACGGGGNGNPDANGDGVAGGDPLDPSVQPPLDTDPSHYPANVWITDGMVKVHPDAAPGDVHWADLHAAKNESESFQVHVRAGASPIQLTVSIGELVDARSGKHIDAAHLLVSREAYLDITTLSDQNGTLGMTPDALIPSVDPYVQEPRNAFPVAVPANETRSAWIDVLVPADAPSGYYTGAVTVTDGGTILATLPVRLAVWDFALPATSTLRSGFGLSWNGLCVQAYGSYNACGAYPGSGNNPDKAIELTHISEAVMWMDYRVSLAADVYDMPHDNDWTHFDALYGPLMDGTAPTRIPGAKLSHLWFTGDQTSATDLSTWHAHFDAKGWSDRTSVYYCDEPPNGCSFAETRSKADFIHTSAPGLATLLTTDITEASANDLLDRVDVMVPIVESMEAPGMASIRSQYDTWLAKPGKHLWWYQSCDEHESCSNGTPGPKSSTWPSYMVDATPVRNRVFQWLAYLYKVEGELYYDSDYCWDTTCGGQNDPWASIYAFGGNGDGTLFYPGTAAKIGGSTPVPVPSIRLALIRDGMEDYEYLHLAGGSEADAAIASFITNNYTFDNDPTKLQAARLTLGNALHKRAHP
ncbi:MAG TPA: glycoside hydrolase domain-containing protein [Kofleriaceae bacterium]|nr:glycoside hydrolase domain-containing protein [Kofleriaceae bacterium]